MGVPETAIVLAQAAPDLSGLPMWAQILGYAIFGIGVAAIGLITRFGFRMGRTTPPASSDKAATVAAVIVDPEALNRATDAVLSLNGTIGRLTDLVGQHVADQREEREEREVEEKAQRRAEEIVRERARRPRRVNRSAKT